MQRDLDVAVLARVRGGLPRAGGCYVFAEAERDEGPGFGDVGGGAARGAAGAGPGDFCGVLGGGLRGRREDESGVGNE